MDAQSEPSGFENGSLLAYLDGALDEETRRQVEATLAVSPSAAEEARNLAAAQDGLQRGLKATRRPSAHELGEYLLGLLPASRARAVEAQATADPAVADALAQLRAYLARLDLPRPLARATETSLVQRVAVLVGRLSGFGAAAPAPAGVRGGEAGPIAYEAGSYQVTLETQEDAEGAGQRSLLGLLIGGEPEGIIAELYRADDLAGTATVDRLGNFIFTGISPATYDLLLHGAAVEIVLPDVTIG